MKVDLGFKSVQMANIEPQIYFPWSLERRMEFLGAPSVESLCKTMIMENTNYREQNADDPHYVKYLVVVIQYCRNINAQKVLNYAKQYQNSYYTEKGDESKKIGAKGFKFRLASKQAMADLSGYEHNAVTPLFMKSELAVVLDEHIAELEPAYFWMGGGRLSLKLGISLEHFKAYLGPRYQTADITY